MGSGHVVGPDNPDSRQSDLIIYDNDVCGPLFGEQLPQVFPVEGVHGIIEVKSRLSKAELLDGLEKSKSFKEVAPQEYVITRDAWGMSSGPRPLPFGIIFSYDLADNSLESIEANLREYESQNNRSASANLIVVLSKGLIVHKDANYIDRLLTEELSESRFAVAHHHKQHTLCEFYATLLQMSCSGSAPLILDAIDCTSQEWGSTLYAATIA